MNTEEILFAKVVMLEAELTETRKKLIEVERLLIQVLNVVKGNTKHDI